MEDVAPLAGDVVVFSGMEAMVDSSVGIEVAATLFGDVEVLYSGVARVLSLGNVMAKDRAAMVL